LRESRKITQFDCPNLSEKQLTGFKALVLVSPLDAPDARQNRLIRLEGIQKAGMRLRLKNGLPTVSSDARLRDPPAEIIAALI